MAKYGSKAQELVEREMKEMKAGKLRSGSGQKVTNPKQAIAIALSEARRSGTKMPAPPPGTASADKEHSDSRAARKKAASKEPAKKAARKEAAPKKAVAKKSETTKTVPTKKSSAPRKSTSKKSTAGRSAKKASDS